MTFNADAWREVRPIYAAILEHPFNRELAAGTLERERFRFYMLQDAYYLTYFAKALAVTAARAGTPDELIDFAGSAREAVVVERALHEGFFREFGVPPEEAAAIEPSPTCSHYVHYLLSTAHNAPYEIAVAALLPCFQIYWEVGKHLLTIAAPNNPYQKWIDTYADEEFAKGVRKVIATTDRLADATTPERRAAMLAAYIRASQLEWMFWDSAYRLERWPI